MIAENRPKKQKRPVSKQAIIYCFSKKALQSFIAWRAKIVFVGLTRQSELILRSDIFRQ